MSKWSRQKLDSLLSYEHENHFLTKKRRRQIEMKYKSQGNGTSWDSVLYIIGAWTGFVSVVAKFVLR